MTDNFKQNYYPLDLQCGRNAWQETDLNREFSKRPCPQWTYFRHLLADHLNNSERPPFSAAQMELWATLNQVLRYVADDFLKQRNFIEQDGQINVAGQNLDLSGLKSTFEGFLHSFPAPPLELEQSNINRTLFELQQKSSLKELLLELLLLYIQNRNPALDPARSLFSAEEQKLQQVSSYRQRLEAFDRALPLLDDMHGGRPQSLLARLLEPLEQGATLEGQLQLLMQLWSDVLPEALRMRASSAFAQLAREGMRPGHPGEPDLSPLNPADFSDEEYADFSVDVDWMPRAVLLAKSTYVWLRQLERKYYCQVRRLDQIPDAELDDIVTGGFTCLWLIGIWERSQASLRIKNLCGQEDVAASAYAIDDYVIASDLGGEPAFENLRARCLQRGLDLACDVVTNHTGIESAWMREHPDWFIQQPHPPYPGYRFAGPDLSGSPDYAMQIEDGYYDNSEAAVVCRYEHRHSGDVRYIYHGNDGTHLPWNDTAQLNYLLPAVREGMIQLIISVAQRFRVIRFDAAMTLAKRHYKRLWFSGDGVPSRGDHALSKEEFDRAFPLEFWRELVDRVRVEAPDTLLLAEAFWLMEGYFVRTLGMHRVYNSAFMNMLKREENGKYRETLKNILAFDPAILQRFVNFMSNPDEKPAIEQFGDGDKYFCVATMLATMPGLPMFGHGQIEGLHEKYGMEYLAPRKDESPDRILIAAHHQRIFPLLRQRALFSGAEKFQLYDFTSFYGVEEDVFVYSNELDGQKTLVLCNNSNKSITGRIAAPVPMAERQGWDVVDACAIDCSGDYVLLRELSDGRQYLQQASVLASGGEFNLPAYAARSFGSFTALHDVDGRWAELWQLYGDSGRRNLYLDRDALLLRASWTSVDKLLALDPAEPVEAQIAEILEELSAVYTQPAVQGMSDAWLLQLFAQNLFDDNDLADEQFGELSELLQSSRMAGAEQVFYLFDRIFNHQGFRALLTTHYYDFIDWFDKDRFTALGALILQFLLARTLRDPQTDIDALATLIRDRLTLLQRLLELAEECGYQADKFVLQLEPQRPQGELIEVEESNNLKVLFVASESTPYAKTGGLADVVGSLPRALREGGQDVRVVIPYYRSASNVIMQPYCSGKSLEIKMNGRRYRASIKEAVYDGVPLWFIDTPEFFDRDELYGTAQGDYGDNHLRFGFFARAVLEAMRTLDFKPDLIHLHDWQAGLVPALLKSDYREDPFFADVKTLLTIHNLGYQGMFPSHYLDPLDLPAELNSPDALEYFGRLSFLKGAINLSDLVTTVSPTYCQEIQESERGHGFDGLLRARRDYLHGIINGLDQRLWDPAEDRHIAKTYSADDLKGKAACKEALQRELGLEVDSSKPIVAVVSRLDQQKGINLVEQIWPDLMKQDLQFVLLGSGSEAQEAFWRQQQRYNAGKVSINLTFNEGLSHRIYAAADLFLVPSRYEPCGLTQMIALRYGALPVVRRTGGLADTVSDLDSDQHGGNGFVFDHMDGTGLRWALERGLALYGEPKQWRKVVKRGMEADFSWGNSARQYLKLYQGLVDQDG